MPQIHPTGTLLPPTRFMMRRRSELRMGQMKMNEPLVHSHQPFHSHRHNLIYLLRSKSTGQTTRTQCVMSTVGMMCVIRVMVHMAMRLSRQLRSFDKYKMSISFQCCTLNAVRQRQRLILFTNTGHRVRLESLYEIHTRITVHWSARTHQTYPHEQMSWMKWRCTTVHQLITASYTVNMVVSVVLSFWSMPIVSWPRAARWNCSWWVWVVNHYGCSSSVKLSWQIVSLVVVPTITKSWAIIATTSNASTAANYIKMLNTKIINNSRHNYMMWISIMKCQCVQTTPMKAVK